MFLFFPVNSVSVFRFYSIGKDTKCIETVEYECPLAFTKFCHVEVMFQRNEIMKNLQTHFSMANIHTQKDN